MRVLFVGTNRGGGGTESHFISLARALSETGHEVAAAVCPDEFIHRGLSAHIGIQLFPAEFRSRRDLRTIHDISRLMRSLRPDWLVGTFKAEYWGLALASKLGGVPLAVFSHLDQRVRPSMVSRYMRLVRGVIVPSHYLRRRKIERGLPPSRVAVLANPIDVDRFRANAALRSEMRALLGLSDRDLLLGFVGRFEPPKGVDTLARAAEIAMARNERLHVLWVGRGKSEESLHETVRAGEFAGRHHWMPWLDDVLPAYAAMDLVALPSEGSETFGRVLVEAQACGIPVLGARTGGIPEALIDGETGILVAPGDVDGWANVITELCANDALRARYAAAARDFAMRFDSYRIAEEFPHVLESFVPHSVPEADIAERAVRLARKAGAD
jgi:glycosyltransferase involved in cell wall biosynthesis